MGMGLGTGLGCVDSRLLFAKSREPPMHGTTISKMEVQGMVRCTRSLLKVVMALDTPIERVVIAGDSMCALMSLRREGVAFKPFFQFLCLHPFGLVHDDQTSILQVYCHPNWYF